MRNNFFIGGDLDEKKMTWVKWKKCLASKELGGLGIGSIYGLNLGLLFKWIWRFLCNSPNFWVRVVKIFRGTNGGITEDVKYSSSHSPWSGILSAISLLKLKGIDLLSLCVRKIGNGSSCRFGRIFGVAINLLKRPPRGGAELSQLNDLLSLTQDVVLSDSSDSWIWSVDVPSGYSVASARTLIDSSTLDVDPKATRWNRFIPNKVNVFIWRLVLNKLPIRVNLDRRDIDIYGRCLQNGGRLIFRYALMLWSGSSGSMVWLLPRKSDRILKVLGAFSCGIFGSS
uniref:RNA-directed DNA polymerase, eukaryota, reverse transcriptase zinc-binding domain protein n=1 Tax=Tanacetum cinerariifolium TaxID=118510 RepID=A0A6L2LI64_TANCI|nr:RNA-directed DNA polymerase, eukaryota, reverse transcriptase zinc-binding domain protein [Tanacetum cinerariifolium]